MYAPHSHVKEKILNLDLLNRFKQHLSSIPVSSSTQHYYFGRIKRMVTLALHDELLEKDPFLRFEMPPEKPSFLISRLPP
ncbi:hypothetical protein GCM10028803_11960 [Larkinella knui]